MTISTTQPGLRAVARPIAVIGGHPVYPLQGSGGIRIAVGDDEGSDDDILDDADDRDDDDDDDDEQDEQDELPASMRGKPKAQPRKRAAQRTDDDDDDDGEQDVDGDTPAALRRMEEALGKANRTAAKYRRAGKTLDRLGIDDLPTWLAERGIDPETGHPYGDDVVDPDDDDTGDELFVDEHDDRRRSDREDSRRRDRETTRQIRAARERADRDARDKYVPLLAQLEATNALREAGFSGSKARQERLLRMIDPAQLDVIVDADEFEIQGLDEQIAELVDEFPELFTKRETRTTDRRGTATRTSPARRASGARDVDGGDRGRPARKTGGWLDQVAAEMDRRGK